MAGYEFKIGDKAKVGERTGEVISVEARTSSSIVKIAFEDGLPKTFVSPPTKIEKILSPLERLKHNLFDAPFQFDLHFEAHRLSLAYAYDHLLSLSATRTNLEPYQVEAVHQVLNAYKQRMLIADDVGLGKTIEAGMIIKELALRGRANRILIIVPASLCYQWLREMRERFDENFIIYDSAYVEALKASLPKDANVWEAHNKIITSIDYAKREEILAELERTYWDIILFDEAHKLSVTKYGDKITRSQRFRLAQTLYDKADSLLLLTATPHKGDSFAFYSLIVLLDPYIFENEARIFPDKLNQIMIRRGKDGIKDADGKPVFKPRDVLTVPVKFTTEEMSLYEAVTNYVSEVYNLAKAEKNRAVGFAMVLLQKRMVSSIAAIRSSLKNRLSNLIKGEMALTKEEEIRLRDYIEDPDSMDDWERERFEKKLETLALPTTPEGLKIEIANLETLVKQAETIMVDSKGEELLRFVNGVLEKDKDEKILIFTEYLDTLRYLVDLLKSHGHNPLIIHGGIPMAARREAEDLFKTPSFNLMVATDAAGEGINLQFCHIMVNYDLPWNPNRIDQRIGRLHRYGQKRDVKVNNLFVTNTKEGEILARLMQKVRIIEKELGGRISDIVGVVLEGVDLQKLIMNALAENKPVEVTVKDIEKAVEERKAAYNAIEKSFLLDLKKFDLESTIRLINESRERSASEEDIERFVRAFFKNFNGKIEPTRKKLIYRVRTSKEILREGIKDKYPEVTFSKETAKELGEDVEFIAFGHPLLEAIIDFCRDKSWIFGGRATIRASDKVSLPSILFNFLLSFLDGTGKLVSEELVPILIEQNLMLRVMQPKEIATFAEDRGIYQEIEGSTLEEIDSLYENAREKAIERAREIVNKVQKSRDREVAIKREDAKAYFESRLREEEERIKEFKIRQATGEDMEIALRGAERRLEESKDRYSKVKTRLEEEEVIIEEVPKLLSAAILIPDRQGAE